MKKILLLITLFILTAIQAFSQEINTNVMILESIDEKVVNVIEYNIKVTESDVIFKPFEKTLYNQDFTLTFDEKVSELEEGNSKIIRYTTTGFDDIVLTYEGENLKSVCIKQYNNVNIIYKKEDLENIKKDNHNQLKSYKL